MELVKTKRIQTDATSSKARSLSKRQLAATARKEKGRRKKANSRVEYIGSKSKNAMADKSKMACNKPTKSDRAGKENGKACSGGKEKLIHFGATGYGHNYSAAARKVLKQDTSAAALHLN